MKLLYSKKVFQIAFEKDIFDLFTPKPSSYFKLCLSFHKKISFTDGKAL